jgi:hypothetical protein
LVRVTLFLCGFFDEFFSNTLGWCFDSSILYLDMVWKCFGKKKGLVGKEFRALEVKGNVLDGTSGIAVGFDFRNDDDSVVRDPSRTTHLPSKPTKSDCNLGVSGLWSPAANMTALVLIKQQTNPVPGTVIMYSTSLFYYFTISQNEEGGTANICLDRCQWPPSHCLD